MARFRVDRERAVLVRFVVLESALMSAETRRHNGRFRRAARRRASYIPAVQSSSRSMPVILRILLPGAAILFVQWLFLGHITLWGAYPDAVLLYVAWIGLRHGRQWGSVGGFVLGFFLDAIYGTWGMHMLVKTLMGFLTGLYPASERESLTIIPRQAFLGGLAIALVHNGLFVILLALQAGVRNSFLVTGLWLGSAVYTAFIGTLASLFSSR